jgi:glycosyltransferase family protein
MDREVEQGILQLLDILENMKNRIDSLEETNRVLVRSNKQLIEWIGEKSLEFEDYKENAAYEILDERREMIEYPKIKAGTAAIERIVKEGKSMARFGDGEFAAIEGRVRHRFQNEADPKLGGRLREVLATPLDNLLIGLADNYGSLEKYNEQAKREIRRYMKRSVRAEHASLLDPGGEYYDTYMTRPYVMYADNDTEAPAARFNDLRRIWANRKCVFVEGENTGMGVGNDLFENAAEIRRIIAPAENAFHSYDSILEECRGQPVDTLFLLALGPTATVLAYDLCRLGFQAVDVGHVDLEYEWFLRGEGRRTQVDGKYNNEMPEAMYPKPIEDEVYLGQIIARFC